MYRFTSGVEGGILIEAALGSACVRDTKYS